MPQVLRTRTANLTLLRNVVLFLLVASVGIFLFREPILLHIGNYLVVADPLEHADVIAVMAGDVVARCHTAANLFSQGWAGRVVITKEVYPYEKQVLKYYGIPELETHEKCVAILTSSAVPERAVQILEGYNESTQDEAEKLRDYLEAQGMKRLLVVTSNYHTRRTRLLFRRMLHDAGIQVSVQACPPNYIFDPDDWWTRRRDSKTLLWEYQKLLVYALGYW